MKLVEIYTKNWCGYCRMAKLLLNKLQIPYQKIEISDHADKEKEMIERAGKRTVPQIFINRQPIGGFHELSRLTLTGEINSLIDESERGKTL